MWLKHKSIAYWIHLCQPSCGHGLDYKAHLNCDWKMTKINQKEAGIGSYILKAQIKILLSF